MFLECKVRGNPVKCSKIIRRVMTSRGICYAFNMQGFYTIFNEEISKDFDSYGRYEDELETQWTLDHGYKTRESENPMRASINNEVSFILDIKAEDYSQIARDGIFYCYYLHLPNEIISPMMQPNYFMMGKEILLTLSAKTKKSSESLRSFLPVNRGCYFQDERKLQLFRAYTGSNCEVECFVNFTLSQYGCASFLLPHNDSATICDSPWDHYMQYEIMINFPISYDVLCGCLPTCTDVEYSKKSAILSKLSRPNGKVYDFFKNVTH